MNPHDLMLGVHVLAGAGGFLLGLAALLLPKFGPRAVWHRRVGRVYAVCMLLMAVLSVPLAWQGGSVLLLVIGLLTLGWVGVGWWAIWRMRAARRAGNAGRAAGWLQTHVTMMGSSYIGAWTAFLVNVEPLGQGGVAFWLYALGPTVLGTVLIARSNSRLQGQRVARAV
ncbi:DUF2306 domain-containing protein [Deinococcus sp. YIM 134068]|uniref:DUF2306 domain-containing protein n=1 Tax=Deinococcus lichenicola TaxID=3118910 RepID=UPI002F92D7A6